MTDGASGSGDTSHKRMRVDWRTGKPMIEREEAFWRDHERRRVEQGLGIARYCAANGFALSTYRHRAMGKKRLASSRSEAPVTPIVSPARTRPQAPGFVAVTGGAPEAALPAVVEVTLQGMTIRLHGEAAERVLGQVVRRLA